MEELRLNKNADRRAYIRTKVQITGIRYQIIRKNETINQFKSEYKKELMRNETIPPNYDS